MNVDYTKFDQKNHVDGGIRLSVQNGEVASQIPSLLNILMIFQKYFFTICFVFSPIKESLKLLSSQGQKCILGKKNQICFYQNCNDNFTLSCGNRICLDSPKLDATTFLMLFFFHVSSFMFKQAEKVGRGRCKAVKDSPFTTSQHLRRMVKLVSKNMALP